MSDASRPRATAELPLTRNHLYALGALSLALAVLSFFVGFSAGRGRAVAPPSVAVAKLVPDDVRSGDLEVLLAGVEHATAADAALSFPAELPRSEPSAVAVADAAAAVADAAAAAARVLGAPSAAVALDPALPVLQKAVPADPRLGAGAVAPGAAVAPAPVGVVPTSGWAVQVGQHADSADADRYVATLKAANLAAYKVVALVDGQATWRVRIGGFSSKEAASAALPGVASKSGAANALVTPAP